MTAICGTATDETAPYPSPERLFLTWQDITDRTSDWTQLALEPLAEADESWHPVHTFPAQVPASAGLGARGTPFSQTLSILERLRDGCRVLLVARSRGQVDRLLALLREHDAPAIEWSASGWSASTQTRAPFFVRHGDLSAGFLSSELRLGVLTEEELFAKGARHKPQAKSKAATFLSSLEDLNIGDYVVRQARHRKYRGSSVSGQDFEAITSFWNLRRRHALCAARPAQPDQRYSGAEGHVPRLDRLGGTSWARTTARVKKDIEEMAQELVDLYANRELAKRHSYGYDSTLYHEFEAAFEYEETADQLKAIDDITHDMASSKPMDRLVCGDVGYGKTGSPCGPPSKPLKTAARWRCSFRPRCWRTSTTTISPSALPHFRRGWRCCRGSNRRRKPRRF
jgi:transcription-repair coupling factor (superfamily II helicase)